MAQLKSATAPSAEAAAGSARVVVERPPPGLARGRYAWPPWAIGSAGSAIVLAGLAYLLWRARRARQK